jgi:hypothetical protein
VPTFADIGCHMVSVTDVYGRILGFLDRIVTTALTMSSQPSLAVAWCSRPAAASATSFSFLTTASFTLTQLNSRLNCCWLSPAQSLLNQSQNCVTVRYQSRAHAHIFIIVTQLRVSCGTPSLTGGRVCSLQLFRRTHDQILLSQI